MFEITANIDAFLKAFNDAEKAVGFAKTVALTRTARATSAFLGQEIDRVFDRPVPFTRNAVTWLWAEKGVRDAVNVFVRFFAGKGVPASKYLRAEILGGARRQKRSEIALRPKMGNRGYWVPGPGVTLDAYGNVPGGTIRRIISDLQLAGETGYLANRTARSAKRNKRYAEERYFVPPPGSKLAPGVWVRRGGNRGRIEPALLFVAETNYEVRFDFFGKGQGFAAQRFPAELEQAIREGWHLPRAMQKAMGLGGTI